MTDDTYAYVSSVFELCRLTCKRIHAILKTKINAKINVRVEEMNDLVITITNKNDDIFKYESKDFINDVVMGRDLEEIAYEAVIGYRKYLNNLYFY